MSISDELRAAGNRLFLRESDGYGTIMSLADRIDAEMVELPRDADSVPIHMDDLVYMDDGRRACVNEIDIMNDREFVICWNGKSHEPCPPSGITHERPDSLERIADELEGLSVDSMISDTNLLSSCALDLAKRIRRLAEREG